MNQPQSCVTCRHFEASRSVRELGFCRVPLPEWLYRGRYLNRAAGSVRVSEGKNCAAYQPKEETE